MKRYQRRARMIMFLIGTRLFYLLPRQAQQIVVRIMSVMF